MKHPRLPSLQYILAHMPALEDMPTKDSVNMESSFVFTVEKDGKRHTVWGEVIACQSPAVYEFRTIDAVLFEVAGDDPDTVERAARRELAEQGYRVVVFQ